MSERVSHDIQRRGLCGEVLILECGLANEHFDPAHGRAAAFSGLFDQQGIFGIVDGVEDEGVVAEPLWLKGGFVDVGVHAQRRAVDEHIGELGSAVFPSDFLASQFDGEFVGFRLFRDLVKKCAGDRIEILASY